MATATFDRIPVDEITRRARRARPGHALATVIGAFFFAIAWLVAKAFGVVWFALAWCYMAADEGWRSARGTGRPAPDVAAMKAEIDRLRMENARLGG